MAELNSSPEKTGGKSPRKKLAARVDLTAMVDLAFLLITFFMLTTSMNKPGMFGLNMPTDERPDPPMFIPESRTMTLCIGSNHQVLYYLGMTEKPLTDPKLCTFNKEGLRKAILDMQALVLKNTGKSLMVLIKPSDKSQYVDLVNTLDEMKITGIEVFPIEDIGTKEIAFLKQKNVY
ncbi:biopolymer transporter ExbD [Mucilaginibacter sp. HMF5004]|uniref:ExbD/TolR family protein n=1 Tax=Mucilaginibacter rivuli TaxID=2857527 RepID=UPI001C5EC3DA|nr:biopolymer transporter ExbD [Mucilaginibacter rivuli]MBW4890188.1 biopolymer transporter ExbD [Mucilaginibacter rivuli]